MKKIAAVVLIFILLLALIGCDESFDEMTLEQKVEYKLKNMTLDEKIAQMLIIFYNGNTADQSFLNAVKVLKPGGFILTSYNVTTYSKTKEFALKLQELSEIPMIISIDQEGGSVQRMNRLTSPCATDIPDALSVGLTGNADLAKSVGKIIAEEVRTIGVNTVFAPVVDIIGEDGESFIGNRSYGTNPDTVSEMAMSVANGLEENGVVATYKHFPGHGDTVTDSHLELPVIDKTIEELKKKELLPFEAAIKNNAQMIMIGHISLPRIVGDNTPASLSHTIVTELLREDMGYEGLVVTDALNMGAITQNYSDEEIFVKAVDAGCDLLLMPNGVYKAIEIIKENISEERINESVRRILMFKYKNFTGYEMLDENYLGSEEHKNIANVFCVE